MSWRHPWWIGCFIQGGKVSQESGTIHSKTLGSRSPDFAVPGFTGTGFRSLNPRLARFTRDWHVETGNTWAKPNFASKLSNNLRLEEENKVASFRRESRQLRTAISLPWLKAKFMRILCVSVEDSSKIPLPWSEGHLKSFLKSSFRHLMLFMKYYPLILKIYLENYCLNST